MVGATSGWREVTEGSWQVVEGLTRSFALETEGWKTGSWRHAIEILEHPDPVAEDVCVLEITGDDAGPSDDLVALGLSRASQLPVVTLFDVPNQPILDLREDALLAYSFLQAMAEGDLEWPALVPMVRSVRAAMSAAELVSEGRWKRFVVTGASKRGWASWLTAATGDQRVVAAAPRMFDNLHAAEQMKKQVVDWDGYSPMLEDYTAAGLQQMAVEGPAADLAKWLDPATYVRDIKVPVLLVNGANDPFWCADASSVYVGDLTSNIAVVACPGVKHVGQLPGFAEGAFGALCHAACTGSDWIAPRPAWDRGVWDVASTGSFGHRLWSAHAVDGKFDTARWSVIDGVAKPDTRGDCRTAHFVELLMPGAGSVGPYSLTSHVVVSPPVS